MPFATWQQQELRLTARSRERLGRRASWRRWIKVLPLSSTRRVRRECDRPKGRGRYLPCLLSGYTIGRLSLAHQLVIWALRQRHQDQNADRLIFLPAALHLALQPAAELPALLGLRHTLPRARRPRRKAVGSLCCALRARECGRMDATRAVRGRRGPRPRAGRRSPVCSPGRQRTSALRSRPGNSRRSSAAQPS